MLRSADPARLRPRRSRTAALVAAVAVVAALSVALPVSLAQADVATGPLSGTVGAAEANGVMTVWQRVEATWARYGSADIDADGDYSTDVPVGGTYAVTYDDADLGEHDVNADGALGRPADAQAGVLVPDSGGAVLDFTLPPLTASLTVGSVSDGGTVVASPNLTLYALADEGDGVAWLTLNIAPTTDALSGTLQFTGLPAGTYAVALHSTADDHLYLADGTHVLAWDSQPATDGSLGDALAGAAHRTITVSLNPAQPPIIYLPPADPTPTPSTSPTPTPTPTPTPSTSPSPTAEPAPDVVGIATAPVPGVIQPNIAAIPQLVILSSGGGSAAATDQAAVNAALAKELLAAQQQAIAAGVVPPTGPTMKANLVPVPAPTAPGQAMPPGLYVQVIDGLINVANTGGQQSFQAGQFGFVPNFQTPPIILPSNPGLKFAPPPVFATGVSTTIGRTPNPVDCEVRRTDTSGTKSVEVQTTPSTAPIPTAPPVKMYCNRIAVPRTGEPHRHHARWRHHVTVAVKSGKHHVRMPVQHLPGPGWYRIVTTEHLALRFTAVSVHGHRPKHPIHVTRTAAVRSIIYLHVKRH